MISQELLDQLLEEACSLSVEKNVVASLMGDAFKEQRGFIDDEARLKCLFCTRRAAKSYTAGLYMVKTCLENPGVNCLFIGLTRQSAQDIILKDILKVIDQKYDLKISFNKQSLDCTFPNGSIIRITGVDVSEDEMNKLLGKKYKLVCIDEGSLYTINLRHLVYDILGPAMADQDGIICLFGTSSNFTQGLFFDITNGKEQGWSVHRWSAHQNPYINWQKQLDDIKANRPLYMETPQFRQWYLNEWVVETDKLVYKFNADRNTFKERPHPDSKGWNYVLGVDTGWEDDNAFVLGAYHDHDSVFYVLEVFKKNHMYFDHDDSSLSVLKTIERYVNNPKYPGMRVIIDGANKQGVETMRMRSDILFEYADKQSKVDHIEILNGDLVQAKVLIHESCTELRDEMMALVWKTEGDKIIYPKKEHPSLPNHLCDAFLYGWYNGYHFLSTPEKKALTPGTPEYIKEQEDLHKQAIMERLQREQAQKSPMAGMSWTKDRFGRDPWNSWD